MGGHARDILTNGGGGKWKIEQFSGRPETAKDPPDPRDQPGPQDSPHPRGPPHPPLIYNENIIKHLENI